MKLADNNLNTELNSGNITGNVSATSQNISGGIQQGFLREHSALNGRDAANQHPESSITGLTADLAARPSTTIPDEEIMAL